MTLVWILLIITTVVTLAVLGVALFRRFIGVLGAFSDLVGQTAVLDGVHRAEPEERPVPAVLSGRAAASERWRDVSYRRRERRALRRTRWLARGKLLVRADASMTTRFRR